MSKNNGKVPHEQFMVLHEKIVETLPTLRDVEQFLLYELGVSLEEIAAPGNLHHVTFQVIQWAKNTGSLAALTAKLQKVSDTQKAPTTNHPAVPPIPPELSLDEALRALPVSSRGFVGRAQELANLDAQFSNTSTRVMVLVGFGGVGKTALVRHWIASRFSRSEGRLFLACSFFSQGTREQCGSSDQFLYEALCAVRDPEPSKGSLWIRGRRLAQIVSEKDITVILDGLEPLQHGPTNRGASGNIRDPGIAEFIRYMTQDAVGGFCIVTTRVVIADAFLRTKASLHGDIDVLPLDVSIELLRTKGLHGDRDSLQRVAEHLGNHSLALVLGCELARTFYDASASAILSLPLIDERVRTGRHAKSVMAAYEIAMRKDGLDLGIEVLYILGLFDRPAMLVWLGALRKSEQFSGFQSFLDSTDADMQEVLSKLRTWRLLTEGSVDEVDTHALVREYFGERFRSERPKAWKEANASLFRFFCQISVPQPQTQQEMVPALQAVIHACRAGMACEGYEQVFAPRVMRFKQCFATSRLGLHGPVLSALLHFFTIQDADRLSMDSVVSPTGVPDQYAVFLLLEVAQCLIALRSYAAPVAGRFVESALHLSKLLDDRESEFEAQYCRWRYQIARGEIDESASIGRELLDLAEVTNSNVLRLASHRTLATTHFWRGDVEQCFVHATAGVDLDRLVEPAGPLPAWLGDNPGHICQCIQALCGMLQARSAEAMAAAFSVINVAREHGHLHGLAIVYFLSGYLIDISGDYSASKRHAQEMISLSLECGFKGWLGAGTIRLGWSSAMLEPGTCNGEDELTEGMEIWKSCAAGISLPYWHARIAEVHARKRNFPEAIAAVDRGINAVHPTNERWFEAEVYRIKAETILLSGGDDSEAVQLLKTACKTAKKQGSYIFELRASTLLANTLRSQGRAGDANRLLREVLGRADRLCNGADLEAVRQWLRENPEGVPHA